MRDLYKVITDDWVETFKDPKNQNGFMWYAAARGIMPQGVDTTDKRVIALCSLAKDPNFKIDMAIFEPDVV